MERRPGAIAGTACAAPGPAQPLAEGHPLADCDQLFLTVTNTSGKPQDVSVLYLAADFTVTGIWPRQGLVNRLAMGERLRTGLQITPGTAPAREEIWVIATPAEKDAPRNDLTGLASPEVTRSLSAGPAATWFGSRLHPEDDSTATRGFSLKPPEYTLIRTALRILPPDDSH